MPWWKNWEKIISHIGPVRFIILILAPYMMFVELADGSFDHEDFAAILLVALFFNDFIISSLKKFHTSVRLLSRENELIGEKVDYNQATNITYLGQVRPLGSYSTVYRPSHKLYGPYFEKFMDEEKSGRGVLNDPHWLGPVMKQRRKQNRLFVAGLIFLLFISFMVDVLVTTPRPSIILHSLGFLAWSFFMFKATYKRRYELAGAKFKAICYQMAVLSAFIGLSLIWD